MGGEFKDSGISINFKEVLKLYIPTKLFILVKLMINSKKLEKEICIFLKVENL